jgi:uroporphyrinogen decarboxylase
MTSRERVRRAIAHREPDRVPVHDNPWPSTVERWRREGLPADADPAEYFGYDIREVSLDISPRIPIRTLHEDREFITRNTEWGAVRRDHKDFSTTPEIVDTPIKSKADWTAYRRRLESAEITAADLERARAELARHRERGLYVAFHACAGYDRMQSLIRSEELLLLMAEDPEYVAEIAMTLARRVRDVMELAHREGLEFDALWLYNDMGYRNAALFSPATYRRIIQPGDRLLFETAHRLGMQTILHSDGCVRELIPDLLDAGLDCLQPLEVKAGMDPIALKKEYGGRLALFGGIDARAFSHPDPAVIEEEIRSKLSACMPGGGYLYHSDHSIPNNVSLAQYRVALEWVKRYGEYTKPS